VSLGIRQLQCNATHISISFINKGHTDAGRSCKIINSHWRVQRDDRERAREAFIKSARDKQRLRSINSINSNDNVCRKDRF
jgi:hypothetical protein